jgi:hypothetical protein
MNFNSNSNSNNTNSHHLNEEKISLEYFELPDFFNVYQPELTQQMWQMIDKSYHINSISTHQDSDAQATYIKTEQPLFSYYTVPVQYDYGKGEFYLLKFNDDIQADNIIDQIAQDKALPYVIREALMMSDGQHSCIFASDKRTHLKDVAQSFSTVDKALTTTILNSFSQFILSHTQEAQTLPQVIVAQQKAMVAWLNKKGSVIVHDEIDFNFKDPVELKAWYVTIKNERQISINELPAFNDLDYTPFLINGNYMIRDVSSNIYFVYKPLQENDMNNGTWYSINRDRVWDEIKKIYHNEWPEYGDVLQDVFYESHQLENHALCFAQKPENLIARFKDGQIVDMGEDILTLDLFQSFIVETLQEKGEIAANEVIGVPAQAINLLDEDDEIIIHRYSKDNYSIEIIDDESDHHHLIETGQSQKPKM